ncbi:GtrA family protein [Pseudomonas wadenswilerensis]|jgi:putative flippase GtrA|uniref:Bactoprenol-linked glucose translocase n=1 Tax=Pseudomonas wadenswilerensis TaxID=1785161 RepID=A0A380SX89_9PSED|nr:MULTISPECIES: GtrA family protein [Pseudomonas]SPO65447.1 bactoprenol-linked glucose translocase (flippase); CPS-53 (KpLE1) prophage [Pseudomonas sp. JV241A]SUQ61888.1 Bactoprenol-linked glucose translocase homolog from prophage CPS-53 [Pseudomonas wadenswilerensis]
MANVWKGFSTYAVIGIANTLVHWQLFFVLREVFALTQALSNLLAFCVAASLSFYVNALYTFAVSPSFGRYLLFMLCLGGVSLAVGWMGDHWRLHGMITVVTFSLISLTCGFLLSRWLVFRRAEP